MTKLEYLRSRDAIEKICTWKALGENEIKPSTKIYTLDTIYRINIAECPINGYLVYCTKEYIGTEINWINAQLYDYSFGEISFTTDIVSPYFKVLLIKNEYDDISQESDDFKKRWKNFIPYEGLNSTDHVTISEDDYRRCISCLGFPFVTEEELEFTRDEITELAIKPALEEYFHWIPAIIETTENVVSGADYQEVDFPDSSVYAVVGLSLQQTGGSLSGNNLSPLFYGMEQAMYSGFNYSNLSGTYYGSRPPYTNTNTLTNVIANRANAQALINYGRRVHYEGPYKRADGSQYIRIYSNNNGVFNIWWARQTLDFNDVEFANRTRVIEYAQANIKEMFANLRKQVKSDIPGLVDWSNWLTEAKATKERILGEYKKIVKASSPIRGSL